MSVVPSFPPQVASVTCGVFFWEVGMEENEDPFADWMDEGEPVG